MRSTPCAPDENVADGSDDAMLRGVHKTLQMVFASDPPESKRLQPTARHAVGQGDEMPLSDHEREQLEQIENDLLTNEPRLAASLNPTRVARQRKWNSILTASLGLLAGFAILFLGLRLANDLGTAIGVLGSLAIVAACNASVTAARQRH